MFRMAVILFLWIFATNPNSDFLFQQMHDFASFIQKNVDVYMVSDSQTGESQNESESGENDSEAVHLTKITYSKFQDIESAKDFMMHGYPIATRADETISPPPEFSN